MCWVTITVQLNPPPLSQWKRQLLSVPELVQNRRNASGPQAACGFQQRTASKEFTSNLWRQLLIACPILCYVEAECLGLWGSTWWNYVFYLLRIYTAQDPSGFIKHRGIKPRESTKIWKLPMNLLKFMARRNVSIWHWTTEESFRYSVGLQKAVGKGLQVQASTCREIKKSRWWPLACSLFTFSVAAVFIPPPPRFFPLIAFCYIVGISKVGLRW